MQTGNEVNYLRSHILYVENNKELKKKNSKMELRIQLGGGAKMAEE